MKTVKITALVVLGCFFPGTALTVFGEEPQPTYRYMVVYGTGDLAVGDTVEFFTAAGVLCGRYEVVEEGGYGLMSVFGNDPSTAEVEGPRPGELLFIRVNGREVVPPAGLPVWNESQTPSRIDL